MSARREFTVLTISSHEYRRVWARSSKRLQIDPTDSNNFLPFFLASTLCLWIRAYPRYVLLKTVWSTPTTSNGSQRWWRNSGSFHVYLMNNLIKLMSGAIFKKDVSLLRDSHGKGAGDVWHFRLILRWFKRPLWYPLRPLLGKRFQAVTWHNRVYIGQNLVVPKWPISSDCDVIRTRLNVAWPYRENRFFAEKPPFRLKIFSTVTILKEFPNM